MINSIEISNFRQFPKIKLEFEKNIVILVGDNTKGKSSIIEALHIITNGVSPWNEFSDVFTHQQEEKNFRIEILVDSENTYSFYKDKNQRILKIDGRNAQSKKFFEKSHSILFSPELIEILMISPTKRRDFLDRSISYLHCDYASALLNYEKLLKHRNAYIRKLSKKFYETGILPSYDTQLNIWSDQMIKYSLIIQKKRIEYLDSLKETNFNIKYIPSLEVDGFESMADEKSLYDYYSQKLKESFKRDVALGYTNIGPHRDDWDIITDKDIKRYGSRGEKRLAIIQLLFRINSQIQELRGISPLLLLDDVPSELDEKNTKDIMHKIAKQNQQSIITTIKLEYIPKEILKEAQVIDLNIL